MASTAYFSKVMKRVFGASPEAISKMVKIIKADGNGTAILDSNVRSTLSGVQRRQLDLLLKADSKDEAKMGGEEKKAAKSQDEVKESAPATFRDFLLSEAQLAADAAGKDGGDKQTYTLSSDPKQAQRELARMKTTNPRMSLQRQITSVKDQIASETDAGKLKELRLRMRNLQDEMRKV